MDGYVGPAENRFISASCLASRASGRRVSPRPGELGLKVVLAESLPIRSGESMYVNLDTMPAWAVVLAEIIALGLLGVTLWFIAKPQLRRRIPVALGIAVVLALVQTRIQERGWRVSAWLIVVVCLTFALSALGRRGNLYSEYWRIEQKYGKKSKEINSFAMKMVVRIVVIMTVLLVLSAIFIKGAYSQGA